MVVLGTRLRRPRPAGEAFLMRHNCTPRPLVTRHRRMASRQRVQRARGRIIVAPADGPTPIPESAWLTIAEAEPDDYANWSPDGKALYFAL